MNAGPLIEQCVLPYRLPIEKAKVRHLINWTMVGVIQGNHAVLESLSKILLHLLSSQKIKFSVSLPMTLFERGPTMADHVIRVKILILFAVAIMLFVSGCAATQSESSSRFHSWEGDVSGMITGKLNLKLQIEQVNKNTKAVSGKISIKIEAVDGGLGKGRLNGTIKGEIKDGNLEATFTGMGYVTGGQAPVSGSMTGTLSFNSGQGDLVVITPSDAGALSADWTVRSN